MSTIRNVSFECTCVAYIHRDGAVAAMGHDLVLEFPDCWLEMATDSSFVARVRTGSVRVVGVVNGGGEVDVTILSDFDRRAVDRDTKAKVLESERYPEAVFRSTAVVRSASGWRITGNLDLHGTVRTVSFDAERQNGNVVGHLRLHQPDFNIEPFRAALGLLRLKPDVDVSLAVPLAAGAGLR